MTDTSTEAVRALIERLRVRKVIEHKPPNLYDDAADMLEAMLREREAGKAPAWTQDDATAT